jgi:predicted MPP superfamily phosphohydrolase
MNNEQKGHGRRGPTGRSMIPQFIVFFLLFMTMTLLMHTYVFLHLSFIFNITQSIWFWLILIIASLSFVLGMALRFMTSGTGAISILFYISSIWLGVMFLFLFFLLVYDGIRLFIFDVDTELAGRIIVGLVIVLSIYSIINGKIIFVKTIKLSTSKLNQGLNIVHLSDIHIGSIHGPGYLSRIVDKTNKLDPDVVLLTGDLADGGYDYTDATFKSLDDIKAPVYFSVGNHEYYAGLDVILDILSRTKVNVLRNKKTIFKNIEIIGLDYEWGKKNFVEMLKGFKADSKKYTILMFHNPVGLKEASKHDIDLMLSGHTHGGQFFPIMLIGRMIWKYNRGLHRFNNSYIFTSTGVGTFGPPMRLGTNNQIALITISDK